MRRHLLLPGSLGLAGLLALSSCGYSQEEFETEFIQALCDKYAQCEMFDASFTEDECRAAKADTAAEPAGNCVFDKSYAEACITSWQEMPCPDIEAGETFGTPESCQLVCQGQE